MSKLKVAATNTGNGVFACVPIKKGAVVHSMGGTKIATTKLEAAIRAGEVRIDDPFQIAEERFLILDRLSYLFNHSCEPNVGVSRRFELVALRDIGVGEEVTYDYSTTVCTHCQWLMHCLCGASTCRKKIRNILSVPKKRRAYFVAEKMLPLYIAKEVA